jgi:L,D-transpeptidase ErfK/SrfK
VLGLLWLCWGAARAGGFVLPPPDVDLIGAVRTASAGPDDTLLDVARRHGVGQEEILLANPQVDRWLPEPGTEVRIPARYVLPQARREGLVLNLPEMRLYHFEPDADPPRVTTHPVSVGRMDWKTPLGETRVSARQKDPAWFPPESVRAEAAAAGESLPERVPPGPDNPLGSHALRLGLPGYLIHGTNKPYGVGMRVTHGCIRLYPEDIAALYERVPVGTPVQIVNQPVKLGWLDGLLFIEVHPPLEEESAGYAGLLRRAVDRIHEEISRRPAVLDGSALKQALRRADGIPVLIARPPDEPAG